MKHTITLKTIGPNSANELSTLWQRTFREAYLNVHSNEDIEKYCKDNYSQLAAEQVLADVRNHSKLAYRDQIAVGFYILKQQACPLQLHQNTCELKQLYLLSSEYGRGIANILFNDIITCAIAERYEAIWLSVSDKNHRAKTYYRKLGFKRLGDGPSIPVGSDTLISSILILPL